MLIAEVSLTNNEEFGVEIGLQSPVLFSRSVIPAGGGELRERDRRTHPAGRVGEQHDHRATPGPRSRSTTTTAPRRTATPFKQGIVGFQGLTNYGVGRANANGIGGFVFSRRVATRSTC